jgi:aromatic-L-amino-acid/L-tryptophan decarboxylase
MPEMNTEEFRRHGHTVVDLMADYLDELPMRPPWRPVPEQRRELLTAQRLPESGRPFGAVVDFVSEHVLPHPFGNGSPRFFAWGNPPPALEGVLAELIATTMNPSCAGGDHAAVHLERCAVRWLAELIGFPGDGVLVSGGASGALTALAAARHRASVDDGWNDRVDGFTGDRAARLRIYAGDEAHSCHAKAAQLLGLGDVGLRTVPTDLAGHVDVSALAAAVREDRAGGLRPFCVVASAGVVSTGAVDPLADLGRLCHQEALWFHVDASLGGFGILDPRCRARFEGLELADSVVLDPHKWLSVPIDCAAVLTRDVDDLRATFSLVPPYLRAEADEPPWFSEYVHDQTRPFRALKLWATIAGLGRDGLARRIAGNVDHAARLAGQVDQDPDLELVAPPELNVVAFRHLAGDDVNAGIPTIVNRAGEVYLRGTTSHGREVLRACFMHAGTTDVDVDRIVPEVRRAAAELTGA